MLLINFKAYDESFGMNAIKLAKIAEKVSLDLRIDIGVVPNFLDLRSVCEEVKIPVFAPHVDPYEPGAHTGSVLPKHVRSFGVYGVVLNHAEKRLRLDALKKATKLAEEHKLKVLICADDEIMAKIVASLQPDYVAIEPPELIGGKVSVVTRPELVKKGIKAVKSISKKTEVLVGAGVHSKEDVKKAIKLGAKGVFVASSICKAKEPEEKIRELAEGLK